MDEKNPPTDAVHWKHCDSDAGSDISLLCFKMSLGDNAESRVL